MIAFLQPLALLGLLAAAIPAVLHLLTRRSPPTVPFPAVRYLAETEQRQSRRLKLRHLLLLLLRTGLIASVVLAAARVAVGRAHAPTALALVLDNSLSSGAVAGGGRVLDRLTARARDVVRRVAQGDRLWVMLADGVPRPLSPTEALTVIDSVAPSPRRLDLGRAARTAQGVVASAGLPEGEIVILSDLQRSALSAGDTLRTRVLAWTPGLMPENRGIDSAWAEPATWSDGGDIVAAVGGERRAPVAVGLALGSDSVAVVHGVAYGGDRVVLTARSTRAGWLAARVTLDPDELRADDAWFVPVRVAPPAAAAAGPGAGRYVAEALAVLQAGGRVRRGQDVVVGDALAGARAIVLPPADPAAVGTLNRALAAHGVAWRFGARMDGEWQVEGDVGPAQGATITRRYRLVGEGTVLARAGGEPWLVRDHDVVLLGSRLEDGWTGLPVSAAFVPFVDLLVNRIAAGQAVALAAAPGDVVELPAGADALLTPEGPVAVTGDRRITAPRTPGVYYLRAAAGDTVGALAVNHDPRESRLAEADGRVLRAVLGGEAQLLGARALDRELFGGARRADLSGVLLLVALLALAAEFALASLGARAGRAGGGRGGHGGHWGQGGDA
jgi:Aerotolerance regulator N-terminal